MHRIYPTLLAAAPIPRPFPSEQGPPERGLADPNCGHAGVEGHDFIEIGAPAAGNDHLVAELVERLGEPAPDAEAAAGDEDGVACEFHALTPLAIVRCAKVSWESDRQTSAIR
jgi:hypothetical protein